MTPEAMRAAEWLAEAAAEYAEAVRVCTCDVANHRYDPGCRVADTYEWLRNASRAVITH